MPKSSRPPDRRSKVAACSASNTGFVPGQHDDRGAEPQGAGAGAEPGQQIDCRRDLAITGEMVLDDKGAVKAERLGLDIVIDEIAEAFAAVELGRLRRIGAPRRRAAEQTEPHRAML